MTFEIYHDILTSFKDLPILEWKGSLLEEDTDFKFCFNGITRPWNGRAICSNLKTCLALFVVPMLWMLILFLICSAVGVSTPFSVSRLIRGFRATAIPLNFLSPPSGVACLNCMFGLMQVSNCNSKKGYYYVSQIRSYQFIALTHNLHSLALKKKSVRNENGTQCRDMYNIDFSVISPSIYGAHFLVPLTWRFRYIQWTG